MSVQVTNQIIKFMIDNGVDISKSQQKKLLKVLPEEIAQILKSDAKTKKPRKLSSYTVFSKLILKMTAFKDNVPVKLGEGEDAVAGFRMRTIGALWQMVPQSIRDKLEPTTTKMPKEYKLPMDFLEFYKDNYLDLESDVEETDPKKHSKAVSKHIVERFLSNDGKKTKSKKNKPSKTKAPVKEESDSESESESEEKSKPEEKADTMDEDSDSESDSE